MKKIKEPEVIERLKAAETFVEKLRVLGVEGLEFVDNNEVHYWTISYGCIVHSLKPAPGKKYCRNTTARYRCYGYTQEFCVLFATPDGVVLGGHFYPNYSDPNNSILGGFSVQKNLNTESRYYYLFLFNTEQELMEIALKVNPYCKDLLYEGYKPHWLLLRPELETLIKAGYQFCDFAYNWEVEPTIAGAYNRLTNRGEGSPKKIFKAEKSVYTVLKDEKDLKVWDEYRKLAKFSNIPKEDMELLYQGGYNSTDMKGLGAILRSEYNGKRLYTLSSLLNYLDRLDMYEAIYKSDALLLLSDYIKMCRDLGVEPKLDSDSLRREHDVMARNHRQKHDIVRGERIKEVSGKYAEWNYDGEEKDPYFIRAILDHDDLLDEASQQRNCVACYADRIISGHSRIFVMRLKKEPEKSLITIEISKSGQIRQKYLSSNRKITNTSQLHFINKWRDWILTTKM